MAFNQNIDFLIRQQLVNLLQGGFAPVVILLREFHYDKTGIVLDGLHFSAFSLLGHMQARQNTLLNFMRDPENNEEVWEDAHWPQKFAPDNEKEWLEAIDQFEAELEEAISIIQNPQTPLYEEQENGKTISWAAMALFHHNGYHIGQMKAIGRQLGVW
ncbi:hypothetical protein [Cesiribacter sp. SM1]|uniref:hypothetical protein n=1 Tax=Cesiribacter sp. SM1 TaxID=2861196 RepID=UPI001CD65E76|nr:hypothetical protein [Cesiribacter sp. SM1]